MTGPVPWLARPSSPGQSRRTGPSPARSRARHRRGAAGAAAARLWLGMAGERGTSERVLAATVPAEPTPKKHQRRRPTPNTPRTISRAAVRIRSRAAGDFMMSCTTLVSFLVDLRTVPLG